MQTGGWRGDGAFGFCEDCLVAFEIFAGGAARRALDVGRERHFAIITRNVEDVCHVFETQSAVTFRVFLEESRSRICGLFFEICNPE